MYTGGCGGTTTKVAIAVVIIITLLVAYYVLYGESFCGGMDQLCACDGNEKMTVRRMSEGALSKVAVGL